MMLPSCPVYVTAMHAVSPAGAGTAPLAEKAFEMKRCLTKDSEAAFPEGRLGKQLWEELFAQAPKDLTPFEALAYGAAQPLISNQEIHPECRLILSTTKGNVSLLGAGDDRLQNLSYTATRISRALCLRSEPVVVSQACISGLVAVIHAARLLQAGRARQVLVIGADMLSDFIRAGFAAFHALDALHCRPYDEHRQGLNLGEGAGAMLVTSEPGEQPLAVFGGGATTNDANHISGPSRTGQELALAINRALLRSGIASEGVDAISGHGTATPYNDEMESKAYGLAGVAGAPVHSLKSIIGHTLGAAGILESIVAVEMLQQQKIPGATGFDSSGVSQVLMLPDATRQYPLRKVLKAASGFGGVNAAGIWMAPEVN